MRKVSMEELAQMMAEGDKLTSDDGPVVVEGFKEFVMEFRQAAQANKDAAELNARTVQSAVDKIATLLQNSTIDMGKLESLITMLLSNNHSKERPDYFFHVERDGANRMTGIRAQKLLH